jgi:predicted dehydrogenase
MRLTSSADRILAIAVVGSGHMGSLHAQKVVALADAGEPVRLVGVADIRMERANALGRKLAVPSFSDTSEVLIGADAVIVAVPTVSHFSVVTQALEADCDVLVEKPIAATLDEAEKLLELAESRGLLLQVGHLEWFNNAMQIIHDRIRRPRFIEAHRLGPFTERATDIDVVRDLMIHDLDILQQLVGEEPERIEAVGVPVLSSSTDIANARITFPDGCVANLTASRVSPAPMRKLRFFQRDGYFSIDFLAQSGVVIRREPNVNGGPPEIKVEKLEVDRGDALLAQLREFTSKIRTRARPRVDGLDGLGALRTALRVIDAITPFNELE